MNDLISRQQAIDALDCINGVEEVLRALPSAQADSKELSFTHKALDTISRAAAIDVLHGYFDGMLETDTWSPCDVYGLIEILPSAEPKRKKGKWVNCYTDGFGNMCKCSECGAMIDIQEKFRSFFCYHCGADMREDVLPSAQPEQRLSCKNCIHLGHGYMMPCKNCKRNQMLPDWYEV